MTHGHVFRSIFDNEATDSVASRLRRRRLQRFEETFLAGRDRVTILDVGGTPGFWSSLLSEEHYDRVAITCVNLDPQSVPSGVCFPVRCDVGDACHLTRYPDRAFDVVFSNSVIEHVGDFERQRQMAAEVRRVGRAYWVQTPNRYFPLEPHYLFPGFQFLPLPMKRSVAARWPFGWMAAGSAKALQGCEQIRLLSPDEMRTIFPGSHLLRERLGGLTKSLIAVQLGSDASGWVPFGGARAPVSTSPTR